MKIMIGGGYDESIAETEAGSVILKFARKLAAQIILQKHELRCGNLSSLDELVIDSACDAAEETGLDPESVVVSYHLKEQDPRSARGAVNGSKIADWNSMSGRKLNVPEPIEQADVLILLGGFGDATGTYTAANWARQTGTPLLPVATFGLAASDIFDDLPDMPATSKITGLSRDDLQLLTKSKAKLNTDKAILQYAAQVVSLAEKAALSRDVFVIMSFEESDDLDDYKAAVEQVCQHAGFEAIRTDSYPSLDSQQIIDEIHDHIGLSVICAASNQRGI